MYILERVTEFRAIVSGHVQGVAYRPYVQDAATKLGLVGFVRNEPDGTVTVVAQGALEILKELLEYLHEGSLFAKVESVAVEWGNVRQQYDEFSIKHE